MSAGDTPDTGNPDSRLDSAHESTHSASADERVEAQTCPIAPIEPNAFLEERSESESRRRFLRAAVITSAAAAGAGGVIAGILGLTHTSAPIKFVGGALSCSCPPGEVCCSGVCVNVQTDPTNCGACGNVCSPTANVTAAGCVHGSCTVVACNPGWADCDNFYPDGCETNTLTNPYNCGACGHVCGPYANVATVACTSGTCAIQSCDAGYFNCDGNVANGCECAGTGCCGGGCQTAHSDGWSDTYYDCFPLFTYNLFTALDACHAYAVAHGFAPSDCVATTCGNIFTGSNQIVEISGTEIMWSYSGAAIGHTSINPLFGCLTNSDPTWD